MNEQEKLRALGLAFDGRVRMLPTIGETSQIAMDAALQTVANVNTPEMFATFVSPEVVEILVSPMRSEEIFSSTKRADWPDQKTMFQAVEFIGQTTEYSDFGRGVLSDANIEQCVRDTHRFQTFIQCGDLEQDMVAKQKINLLQQKQKAAALALKIEMNNANFFGVSGKSIYGLLNDPALPAAITPATVDGSKVKWEDKGANDIYNDLLALVTQISEASDGLVDFQSDFKLLVPPSVYANLAKITELGIAPILEVLKRHFPKLEILAVPQMEDEDGVCKAMLIATDLMGTPTGTFGFSEKLKTFRVMLEHSSISQKWASGTTGFLLFRPFCIATMQGI